jgi:hypothetical protein
VIVSPGQQDLRSAEPAWRPVKALPTALPRSRVASGTPNSCGRENDKTLTRLIWVRVLVGALLKFAVIVAWKLINSEH